MEKDRENNILRVLTELKVEREVKIGKKTTLLLLGEDLEFKKIKLSKLKENDYIIFVYQGGSKTKVLSAIKVLVVPQELIEGLRAEKLK